MRRAFTLIFAGGLVVTAAVAWFGPRLIAWYYNPPVELGVTCKPAVEWGIAVYQKLVLAGTGAGFLLGAAAALVFRPKAPAVPKA
ncbi:MAG: hypothetical protein HYX59_05190 [Elusimicrobia bacterium]|nr:hypothetical protein [Elusimicrobiota bacterium]